MAVLWSWRERREVFTLDSRWLDLRQPVQKGMPAFGDVLRLNWEGNGDEASQPRNITSLEIDVRLISAFFLSLCMYFYSFRNAKGVFKVMRLFMVFIFV